MRVKSPPKRSPTKMLFEDRSLATEGSEIPGPPAVVTFVDKKTRGPMGIAVKGTFQENAKKENKS